jgi:hypothetical protein
MEEILGQVWLQHSMDRWGKIKTKRKPLTLNIKEILEVCFGNVWELTSLMDWALETEKRTAVKVLIK